MLRFFTVLSLMFNGAFTQINPIRDPSLTIAPTVAPVFTIGPIVPVRTIGPIVTVGPTITLDPGVVVINRTSTSTSTSTDTGLSTSTITSTSTDTGLSTSTSTDTSPNSEPGTENSLILVYTLVPIGILAFLLILMCLRKKRAINNNNVVNIDLNIENTIPQTQVSRQPSNISDRFSNHIYEEVDYESRYEMPTIRSTNYENVTNDNEYGKQVTSII